MEDLQVELSRREFTGALTALAATAVLGGHMARPAGAQAKETAYAVNKRHIEAGIRAGATSFSATDTRVFHAGGKNPQHLGKSAAKKLAKAFADDGWYLCAYGVSNVAAATAISGYVVNYRASYYLNNPDKLEKARKKAASIAKAAKKKRGSSKTKQMRYVHDWLARNVSYPTARNAPKVQGVEGYELYTAYGALVDGKAYCLGYATAFSLVASYLGVETRVCWNKDHAWNEVKLSGKWKLVDCCFDDPLVKGKDTSKPDDDYWLKTQSQVNKADAKRKKPKRHVATKRKHVEPRG